MIGDGRLGWEGGRRPGARRGASGGASIQRYEPRTEGGTWPGRGEEVVDVGGEAIKDGDGSDGVAKAGVGDEAVTAGEDREPVEVARASC